MIFSDINIKRNTMKTSRSSTTRQNKQQPTSHKPRPEIRDDIDSRSTKERNYTGEASKKGGRKKRNP
jgi:hypothetical protein